MSGNSSLKIIMEIALVWILVFLSENINENHVREKLDEEIARAFQTPALETLPSEFLI